jgi:hypothetical protein
MGEPWREEDWRWEGENFYWNIPNAKRYVTGNFNFSYFIDESIFFSEISPSMSDVWWLRIS